MMSAEHSACVAMLEEKFGPIRLSRMTGTTRKVRHENRYIAFNTAASFLCGGLVSVEDCGFADSGFVLYLASFRKEVFPKPFDYEGCRLRENAFESFKALFRPDRDLRTLISELCSLGIEVQDYLMDAGYVSDDDVDEINFQDQMWQGRHLTHAKEFLYRRGLISFDHPRWLRRIKVECLSSDEFAHFTNLAAAGQVNVAGFNSCFETRFGNKHGNSFAFHNFLELQRWPGFIDAVPGEFLIDHTHKCQRVFVELEQTGKILPENLDRMRSLYERSLAAEKAEKEKAEKEKAEKAEREYSEISEMFGRRGVSVRRPSTEKWDGLDRYTFAVDVDGYEHTMYVMKTGRRSSFEAQVKEEVQDHELMLLMYKDTVHSEMDRLRSIGVGVTHVMEGGGAQMQAFFCSASGYVSIMYLGMKDEPPAKRWTCHKQGGWPGHKPKDPFSRNTFYHGKTAESDLARFKK